MLIIKPPMRTQDQPKWLVGYETDAWWHALKEFNTLEAAAAFVNYLNGGHGFPQGAA